MLVNILLFIVQPIYDDIYDILWPYMMIMMIMMMIMMIMMMLMMMIMMIMIRLCRAGHSALLQTTAELVIALHGITALPPYC